MSTSGAPGLPPPKPEALQLLLTPTPTEQAAYYQRYVQTWKVLRGPGFPLDEARDLERAGADLRARPQPGRRGAPARGDPRLGQPREALRAVRVPTLVIHGDADPLVPVECGIDVAQRVPGAKLADHRGHGPCAADPDVAAHRRRDR